MRVGIYEDNPLGHRLYHVRLIAEALLDAGHTPVLMTSREAAQSVEASVHLGPLSQRLEIDGGCAPLPPSLRGRAIAGMRQVNALAKSGSIDWLLVPYADHIAQAASLSRTMATGVPVEGLLMRSRYAYPSERRRDAALAWASRRAVESTPWRRLMVLDPLGYEALSERTRQSGTTALMPDPADDIMALSKSEARQILGLGGDQIGVLFVLPGSIDMRKGPVELAQAFTHSDLDDGARLLIAGSFSEEALRRLEPIAGADRRVLLTNRLLDEVTFSATFRAADVVCAPYLRHVGSSGIVGRAAYVGAPLLASDYGWVGEATTRYELGITADTRDAPALMVALHAAAALAGTDTRTEVSEPFRSFNTIEGFQETWLAGIHE